MTLFTPLNTCQLISTLIISALLISCSSNKVTDQQTGQLEEVIVTGIKASSHLLMDVPPPLISNKDTFEGFESNPVKLTSESPVSTFSADVDTASYSYIRRSLNDGYLPTVDSVRLEEMVNYFDYSYTNAISSQKPFTANLVVHDSPWDENRKLIHIGIQGYELAKNNQPDSNIVFLLDVSGSMNAPDKLPLVKQSMELLLSQLKETDTVSIVVYAGAAGTILSPTPVRDRRKILEAMNRLEAGGSTAGSEGIRLAYQLAAEAYKDDGVNRVILATDGDFNVGITDGEELKAFIEKQRDKGTYLSVLGFGRGNYQDNLMQSLAQNGNGVAAYIDTLSEAQKVLVHEATSSLFPIATDLKFQVEFNPSTVQEYRLLGYETRLLNREDFNNDKVDAGDIGSGHSVTAIYEVLLKGGDGSLIDDLRYQQASKTEVTFSDELAFLKIRYKLPGKDTSILKQYPITRQLVADRHLEREAKFAAAVAGFAQLLSNNKYLGNWSFDEALQLALDNRGDDEYGYRSEFVQLIRKAKLAQ